jgi:hypothetical protein
MVYFSLFLIPHFYPLALLLFYRQGIARNLSLTT